ncbi:PP2C family protein-serine/threonine phosphatase [Streptomyces monticola]|uniref:PP2C family protein-serine/threonine phosphatase n=1 Tax=Streptomyces monticola TaxID=2666263 RepID=A0ABW2JEC0_9ACTN
MALEHLVAGVVSVTMGALLLGPLFAAARLDVRATARVGGCVLAVGVITGLATLRLAPHDVAVRAMVLAAGGLLAVYAARLRAAREAALVRVGQAVQRAVLPPEAVRTGGMDIATRYVSAAREAVIGGDVVVAANSPYGLRVVVGDVRGHDLHAVRLAATAAAAFRDLAYVTPRLPDLAARLDAAIGAHLTTEDFVTGVIAEFAPGEVRLVNCGHPAPLRINCRLEPLEPAEPAPPLGLHPRPRQQRFRLADGERLLLYTDGLIEARSPQGAAFPLDERVREALSRPALRDCLDAVHDLAVAHADGPLTDDLALVVCQPVPVGALPVLPCPPGAQAQLPGGTEAHMPQSAAAHLPQEDPLGRWPGGSAVPRA